jgi:hypothetical protein
MLNRAHVDTPVIQACATIAFERPSRNWLAMRFQWVKNVFWLGREDSNRQMANRAQFCGPDQLLRLRNGNSRNLRQLSQHRLKRKLAIGIRHRLAAMPRHRIENVYREPVTATESLQAMTPGMVR